MKIRKALTTALVCIALLSLLCACSGQSQDKKLRFGTGGSGGTYFAYATHFSELVKDDYSFEIKTTAGSAANIRLLQNGFIDLAIVQSDILYSAEMGTDMFEGDAKIGQNRSYGAVTGLYTEALQIIVKADSDIHSIEDLRGKRVSVGEEESGVLQNAKQILQVYGMTFGDLETQNLSFSDAADALKNGQLDAFFIMAGAPTKSVVDLAAEADIRLLSIDDREREKLMNLYETYVDCTLPKGTYKGIEEDIHTLGVKAVLVASIDLDAETVKNLTEEIFDYSETLNANVATDSAIYAEAAIDSIPIGFHKGAAEFLNGQGVSVEAYQGLGTSGVFASQDN